MRVGSPNSFVGFPDYFLLAVADESTLNKKTRNPHQDSASHITILDLRYFYQPAIYLAFLFYFYSRVRLRHQHVDRWHDEQRKQGTDNHAAHQHDADAVASARARTLGENQWEVPDYGSRSRHQNRTQACRRRFNHRDQLALSGFLKMVRELHNQDSVLRDQSHQRDESHLTVDV